MKRQVDQEFCFIDCRHTHQEFLGVFFVLGVVLIFKFINFSGLTDLQLNITAYVSSC
jgi:hypothetical protein